MKKIVIAIWLVCLLLSFGACSSSKSTADVVATTKPVYDFCEFLCRGTDITVDRLITENLSCLHDYTLQVRQMRVIEAAEVVVISGAGLEDFLVDALHSADSIIDSSAGIPLSCAHSHSSEAHSDHHHDVDPHIWMDISKAQIMAQNICQGLISHFPERESIILDNYTALETQFRQLQDYGNRMLSGLSHRELVTFHDGFHYFADCWDLTILHTIEEEAGSEASAGELIEIIELLESHNVPAIFREINGSTSASGIISAEIGIPVYSLTTCMGDKNYFDAMQDNINTIKEALG